MLFKLIEHEHEDGESDLKVIDKLFAGAVDVIGDIHGEIDALNDLLGHLGYTEGGDHPEGRRLVFVGDLVDRGPDSPAVLRKVKALVESGKAQCVLGNHELNILRGDKKSDNDWWFKERANRSNLAADMPDDEKGAMHMFLESLPLALERDDLRVVHACWDDSALAELAGKPPRALHWGVEFELLKMEIFAKLASDGLRAKCDAEAAERGIEIKNEDEEPAFMPVKAEFDTRKQMDNPLAVVTSGMEAPKNKKPFYVGGKWRMVDRIDWWSNYAGPKVVFGHFWRLPEASRAAMSSAADKNNVPDVFGDTPVFDWLGPNNTAMCIDFGVAGRSMLRRKGKDLIACRLGALRFPEEELHFDNGEAIPVPSGEASESAQIESYAK